MEKDLELRVRAIIGPEMARLQKDLQTAGMLGGKAGQAASQAGREAEASFRRASGSVKDFNTGIQNTARYLQLVKGVISAFLLYRGFSFLTGQAAQFTRSLVDVQHEVGLIQTQLQGVGKDFRPEVMKNILRTASETGVAMESLARTEYEIVSANIKVADSYRVLNLAAKAAVAGGLKDASLAFDAALSQVNTFNITFERAFDLQFQVLRRGIFNYEQFTTVVGTVSEAFASMGQSAETANAAVAAISQVFTGKQLERGATGIRNAVVQLSEAPEKFEDLGIAVTDANGEFRNFIAIASDLNKVLATMSSSQRAKVIKDLFPDERERRGIQAFIGQLDSAEQFYVEQQFAADTLNDAYETANKSLLTQARIFEQNLTPAMQPFVDAMSGLLGVFNGLEKTLPGVNRQLLTTATIGAVLGSANLLSGGKFPLSRQMPGGMSFMGMPATRAPTGLGVAAASIIPITAFMAAQSRGTAGVGDYAGAGLSGALAGGTVGGLPGAAIGAVASMAAVAIGAAMADKAQPISKTFAERFSEELKGNAPDIATAFSRALVQEAEIAPGVSLFQALQGGGSYRFQRGGSQAEYDAAVREGRATVTMSDLQKFSRLQGSGIYNAGFTKEELSDLRAGKAVRLREQTAGYLQGPERQQVNIALQSNQIRSQLQQGFSAFAGQAGGLSQYAGNEKYQVAIQALAAKSFEDVFGADSPVAKSASEFAVKMFNSGKGVDVFIEALDAASRGDFKKFLELTGQLASDLTDSLGRLKTQMDSLFIGDADVAADVFSRLGDEGERLAKVFHDIGRTVQAFSLLQTLSATKMSVPTQMWENPRDVAVRLNLMKDFEAWTDEFEREYLAQRRLVTQNVDTNLLSSLGIDATQAGQLLVDRLIGDIGLVKGSFSTADFVNALFKPDQAIQPKIVEPLELASNDFADALFQAADQVRGGLLNSTKFSADQLEMFGEDFRDLNRMVRQKALLEQLKGIADFAGVGDKGISGAMDILRAEMVKSGKAMFDLLSDPASLAELIAKMEFGDVNVDNSQNNNIVVRIEGNMDTQAAAAAADVIIARLNEASRQKAR